MDVGSANEPVKGLNKLSLSLMDKLPQLLHIHGAFRQTLVWQHFPKIVEVEKRSIAHMLASIGEWSMSSVQYWVQ